MIEWVGSIEWLARQLLSLFTFLLPVLATFGAVFLGVYLNGIIDREREREVELLRPLFEETSKVKDGSGLHPIQALLEDGKHSSVLLDIRLLNLHMIDQETREKIMAYLQAVEQLAKFDDTTTSTSRLLHESGYGDYLADQLPEEIVLEPNEGIGSGSSDLVPGPHIVAGRRTVTASPNSVLPSNSTRVSGDYRRPLLPILVEIGPLLVETDSSAELRSLFESQTDIDVAYLDDRCPNWADVLWEVLQRPWQSEPIDYQDDVFGNNVIPEDQHQNIVEGEDFEDILTTAGIALQARLVEHRKRVINSAEELHGRLLVRLSRPLYHPKRILLARH